MDSQAKRQRHSVPPVDHDEPETGHGYDVDLLVIGGGSGGLACSKEAAELGKTVTLLDYVEPSPHGTTWGLGGTCVNVGCIPKKLYHTAALMKETVHDAKYYGWDNLEPKLNWETLMSNVSDHVGSLNWGYRVQLREKKVTYLNAAGRFVDPHTVIARTKAGKESKITARRIVIATGGRPTIPDIPGKEHAITSDDVFKMEQPPGKTLVVGGSYIALETAGFLAGLGFDTTVMVRSILLRGFDQEIAELIGKNMSENGTKFIRPTVPTSIEKLDSGKLKVHYELNGAQASDEFDTVMFATGRESTVPKLDPEKAGVRLDPNGKVPVDVYERTNVPHIYAIGDIISGGLELTPVAIQAGKLLSQRLYNGQDTAMDYVNVATTVFTPTEYGAIGLSEEAAEKVFGKDNIEVYHGFFQPLEYAAAHRAENVCYYKLITHLKDNERVVGFHYLGPNAGEVTQGYALGFKLGATKRDYDMLIGIHPTSAEEFTTQKADITKRSGKDPKKSGC